MEKNHAVSIKTTLFQWTIRIIAAGILIQTLFFKFTGAEESVYIFSALGMEPFGRIASGVVELIAAILLLIPRTTLLGAIIGLGVITGALFSHIFVLGIEVGNDGGTLFILAVITFICCLILVFQNRRKFPDLIKFNL